MKPQDIAPDHITDAPVHTSQGEPLNTYCQGRVQTIVSVYSSTSVVPMQYHPTIVSNSQYNGSKCEPSSTCDNIWIIQYDTKWESPSSHCHKGAPQYHNGVPSYTVPQGSSPLSQGNSQYHRGIKVHNATKESYSM